MKKPYIIGIDPGLSGAMAILDFEKKAIIAVHDLPTFKKDTKARKQGFFAHLDVHALAMMIDAYAAKTAIAVLEEPGAMPKQGLSSTFRFGHVCGQIHGALAANYLPTVPVKPQVWKPAMGLGVDKNESIDRVLKEFPESKERFRLKKHHDRAESVLLALFGAKHLRNFIERVG